MTEGMTVYALGLTAKEIPAAFLCRADGVPVACDETVEWRITGQLRSFESRDRFGDHLDSDFAFENATKLLHVIGIVCHARDNSIVILHTHLRRAH